MNPIPRPPAPPDVIRETPVVVAVCGPEGCGKSWLIRSILPRLTVAGIKTAVIKRERRPLDPSGPDRYSTPFRQAGASAVGVFDGELSMVVQRRRITEQHLIAQFQDAGLILLEGFDRSFWPKLELVRSGYSSGPSCDLSTVLALVTDLSLPHCDVPQLPFDCQAVADFLLHYYYREIGVNVMESSSVNKTVSVPEGVLRAALITVSDSIYAGTSPNTTAPAASEQLTKAGFELVSTSLLPRDRAMLSAELIRLADSRLADLVVTMGGTGCSLYDCTPEATADVTERALPGVCEALRRTLADLSDGAMLDRSTSGMRKQAVLVNLPGAPEQALPCLERLLPGLKTTVEAIRQDG